MGKTIALLGALDTKGAEYGFARQCIEARGHRTLLIDVGVLGPPLVQPDVTREEVARAAGVDARGPGGGSSDRGEAMAAMSRGAAALVPRLYAEGRFDAIMALGGGGGTSIACAAMRALPLGVPKVMVSTVAGGDVSGYVGVKDIVMVPAIVDMAGINQISREVFARAAGAVCGMVETEVPARRGQAAGRRLDVRQHHAAASSAAKAILEQAGYEVLVFHATGTGGRTMESLDRIGPDRRRAGRHHHRMGRRAGGRRAGRRARRAWRPPPAAACRRSSPPAAWTWSTSGPRRRCRRSSGAGSSTSTTPTSRSCGPRPRRYRQLGRIIAEKLNLSIGPGHGAAAAAGAEHDRRARRSVLVARGRPGPLPVAQEQPAPGHPGDRNGLQHQRSRVCAPAVPRHCLN